MVNIGLETEAYKLLLSDISNSYQSPTTNEFTLNLSIGNVIQTNSDPKIRMSGRELKLNVRLVWIQGNIKSINVDLSTGENILLFSDGHGEAQIVQYQLVPGGNHPQIQIPGSYVGVVGEIECLTPSIRIRAIKIMSLESNREVLECIWEEEVKDLKAFLFGLIKPTQGKIR